MSKPIKIKATIMWSFHNKINQTAEKYTVDLCNLSDKAVKSLENDLGIAVNFNEDKEDKGKFINALDGSEKESKDKKAPEEEELETIYKFLIKYLLFIQVKAKIILVILKLN